MSETVKLIIEIPKKDIELICKTSFVEDERTMFKQSPSDRQGTMMLFRLMDSVKDGIPLDDVKAEFKSSYPTNYMGEPELNGTACHFSLNKVFEILDNIGKENKE